MRAVIRQLLLLCGLTLLGFGIYLLLFWAGVGASVTILFYRGVVLAIAAALLVCLVGTFTGRRSKDNLLPVAAAATTLSFNICFLVLLPVTVDRSVSVYLLSTIERQQDEGTDASALQRAFIDGYVVKMGAVQRRIDEQRRSGNITVDAEGQVRLTPQGRRFMALCRLVARFFGTDQRLVSGSQGTRD